MAEAGGGGICYQSIKRKAAASGAVNEDSRGVQSRERALLQTSVPAEEGEWDRQPVGAPISVSIAHAQPQIPTPNGLNLPRSKYHIRSGFELLEFCLPAARHYRAQLPPSRVSVPARRYRRSVGSGDQPREVSEPGVDHRRRCDCPEQDGLFRCWNKRSKRL